MPEFVTCLSQDWKSTRKTTMSDLVELHSALKNHTDCAVEDQTANTLRA